VLIFAQEEIPMNRADVERWIQDYRQAWSTDDPEQIGALFTEDAIYSPYPWPRNERFWRGRDEIVQKWIGHGDSTIGWRFEHEVLAVDGDRAVVEGWTDYDRGEGTPWQEAFANIFVIDFAPDGRARSFREWWIQRPSPVEG
jgi:ketosteroid isomerase-like protein